MKYLKYFENKTSAEGYKTESWFVGYLDEEDLVLYSGGGEVIKDGEMVMDDISTPDDLFIPDGYVDLGLSVLWATCNLGAETPEDPGYFYSKGNVNGHKLLDTGVFEDGYTFSEEEYENSEGYIKMSNYINSSYTHPANGRTWYDVDAVYYDADVKNPDYATVFSPCIPSITYWQELIDNTVCTYEMQNGVEGLRFVATNGNSIFIPTKSTIATSDNLVVGNVGGGLTNAFRGFVVANNSVDTILLYTVNEDGTITFTFEDFRTGGENYIGYIGRPLRPVRRNIDVTNCHIIKTGHKYKITDPTQALCITPLLANKNITITFQSEQIIDKILISRVRDITPYYSFSCVDNLINLTSNDITIDGDIYANDISCLAYIAFEQVTNPITILIQEWDYPHTNKGAFLNRTLYVTKSSADIYRIKYDEIKNHVLKFQWNGSARIYIYFGSVPIFAASASDSSVFYNTQRSGRGTITCSQDLVNSWESYVDEYGFIYVRLKSGSSAYYNGMFYIE